MAKTKHEAKDEDFGGRELAESYGEMLRKKVPYRMPSLASERIVDDYEKIINKVGVEGYTQIAELCLKHPSDDSALGIIEFGSEIISGAGYSSLEYIMEKKRPGMDMKRYASLTGKMEEIGATDSETMLASYSLAERLDGKVELVVDAAKKLGRQNSGYEALSKLDKIAQKEDLGSMDTASLLFGFIEATKGKDSVYQDKLLSILGTAAELGLAEHFTSNLDGKLYSKGFQKGKEKGFEEGRGEGYSEGYRSAEDNGICGHCLSRKTDGECPRCDDPSR